MTSTVCTQLKGKIRIPDLHHDTTPNFTLFAKGSTQNCRLIVVNLNYLRQQTLFYWRIESCHRYMEFKSYHSFKQQAWPIIRGFYYFALGLVNYVYKNKTMLEVLYHRQTRKKRTNLISTSLLPCLSTREPTCRT